MRWFGIGLEGRGRIRDERPQMATAAAQVDHGGEAEALADEVAKALRVRRWETGRPGPFKGFGSFPGRF